MLVNGIAHIAAALATRRYNPGLWTSIMLFLPASILALVVVSSQTGVGIVNHAVGLGVSLLIHAAIVIYARQNAAKSKAGHGTR